VYFFFAFNRQCRCFKVVEENDWDLHTEMEKFRKYISYEKSVKNNLLRTVQVYGQWLKVFEKLVKFYFRFQNEVRTIEIDRRFYNEKKALKRTAQSLSGTDPVWFLAQLDKIK